MAFFVTNNWRWIRVGLLFLFYGSLLVGGRWLGLTIEEHLQVADLGQAGMPYIGAIAMMLVAYIVLTAIPFVPGAEIGLALLMVFGAKIAATIYLATIMALTLSFSLGRLVPELKLAGWLERINLLGASAILKALVRLGPEGSDRYLSQNAPGWLRPWLVDHRMATLILLINLPGNTLLGGGGGIALVTGLSKLMPTSQFFLCIVLAVAPVPIVVLLTSWLAN